MLYPVFVNLFRRRCVVVGAGKVAERRVQALCSHGANVAVVSPMATPAIVALSEQGALVWTPTEYEESCLTGAFLAVAATNSAQVNRAVVQDADRRSVLVSCADDPEVGSFVTGAYVERGDLVLAVTTSGASPTLASVVKNRLEASFGAEWKDWTRLFAHVRSAVQALKTEAARKSVVETILQDGAIERFIVDGNIKAAEEAAHHCISSYSA